ncbi:outer membrane protein assembly factor BamB family protein [Micromonospora arborensis]|uniref:outer membrane protein assembly factor BamB family protein n=1 Tax=Micromonospora arborensis TaxID=2116518 RepID=UPI00371BF980
MPTPHSNDPAVSRRLLLGAAGVTLGALTGPGLLATAATAAPAGPPAPPAPPGKPHPQAPQGFALVSDTHLNPTAPARTDTMRAVFQAIAERDPAAVLHCGDITDSGTPAQIALYQSTVPAELAGRIHYTPGNHEVRWDVSAKEEYHRAFGASQQSFDVCGVHVVALDPTMLLQEPGHFGGALLDWLEKDLRRVRKNTPIVIFQHHPVGDAWYYADDQDRFLELVERYEVRVVFAGHVHAEAVRPMNGLVEITLKAVKDSPHYYWTERTNDGRGEPQLVVTRVDLLATGGTTTTTVATVPLTGAGPGADVEPAAVQVSAAGAAFAVRATFGHNAPVAVRAHVLPETGFSGTVNTPFTELTRTGAHWQASLDATALPPGTHQVRLRAVASDGSWWDSVRTVQLAGAGPRVVWETALDGAVQGGLSTADDLVVAGSTGGAVTAWSMRHGRAKQRWTVRNGPVYREPVIADSTVFVPGADHTVTALDAGTGRRRWQVRTAEPVLSTPSLARIDGKGVLLVAAGTTLLALDPTTGRERWRAAIGGFAAGRPACDGERVYVGAGDARAHAFDARTGAPLWTYTTRVTTDPNAALLYGPWDDRTVLVPNGPVVVSSVSATWGLDRATGTALWSVPGSSMYAGPRLATVGGSTALLLIQERGATLLVDPMSGATRWQTQLGFPVFNSGAVIDGDTAWVLGVNSQVGALDLNTGRLDRLVKIGTGYSFSTPVLVGGQLVAADQNGRVRGVDLA